MKHTIILALDPSGSFEEGKGTTGWALYSTIQDKIIQTGYISAMKHESVLDYWNAHIKLIDEYMNGKECAVVMEDYLLYESKMQAQINSRMETPKMLGVIEHHLLQQRIPYYFQTAAEVKHRWSDKILVYKKILMPKGKGHCLYTADAPIINRHCKDAIRHAIHFKTFKNK